MSLPEALTRSPGACLRTGKPAPRHPAGGCTDHHHHEYERDYYQLYRHAVRRLLGRACPPSRLPPHVRARRADAGIFLPLRFYEGDMRVLAGQSRLVSDIDARGFAAAWVRDIPLYDPRFGDAGQLFDPFTYLAYLAARTQRISWPLAAPSSRCATPSTSPNPPPPSTNSPAAASSWASPPATVPSSSPPTACNTTSAPSASPRRWPTSAACSNPAVAP